MDKILQMAFTEPERWRKAIDRAFDKGIEIAELQLYCNEEYRVDVYKQIRDGRYHITPPHTALIPKDEPGKFRTVFINEDKDRILLSLVNDLLFDLCPEMVHPRCRSYQKGISCGDIVKDMSRRVVEAGEGVVGWKSDLSKYFDRVPLRYIDWAFDEVERKHGRSALIDVVREYYHNNLYLEKVEGEWIVRDQYQSLKQGCAVASWLADVILYPIDEALSKMGHYCRYSDDQLFIGTPYKESMQVLEDMLADMDMQINEKKREWIDRDHWFKFLGFSIKGQDISLSYNAIKKFQDEIEGIVKNAKSYKSGLHMLYRYLYIGNGEFSWATRVLRAVNVRRDINLLNQYCMDALRAIQTGRHNLGGLGWSRVQKVGCISRGTGSNVKANRQKTDKMLEGYYTIGCMQNAMWACRGAYESIVREMKTA